MRVWRVIGRWSAAVIGAATFSLVSCTTAPRSEVDSARTPVFYRVTPRIANGTTLLDVEIAFRGDADGETSIALPDRWAGTPELWRYVTDFRVDGATVIPSESPSLRILRHAANQRLRILYSVRTAYDEDPSISYDKARPVLRPNWFFIYGEALFARRIGGDDAPAHFAWGRIPTGWTVQSDLDHLISSGGTVADIIDSIAIGGTDLYVLRSTVSGEPLRLAIRGDWRFRPEDLFTLVTRIGRTESAMWGDHARPFFIPIAPLRGGSEGSSSIYGTGRGDAFAISATTNVDLNQFTFLIAHEQMHSWISSQIGGLAAQDQALDFWLSEGFTDHFAMRSLLRAGIWSFSEFVDHLNQVLARYSASPVREAPNSLIGQNFWSEEAVQKLPYDRGNLFGWLIESRARALGRGGLLDVLNRQRAVAAEYRRQGRQASAATLFPGVLRDVTGFDPSDLIARYIDRGEPILLPADLFGECATVSTRTRPLFDLGFTPVAAGDTIREVDAQGPAYAAGIRPGMEMVRREAGEIGNSEMVIVYRLRDGAAERLFRYLPASRRTTMLQQVVPAPSLSGELLARCTALIVGA